MCALRPPDNPLFLNCRTEQAQIIFSGAWSGSAPLESLNSTTDQSAINPYGKRLAGLNLNNSETKQESLRFGQISCAITPVLFTFPLACAYNEARTRGASTCSLCLASAGCNRPGQLLSSITKQAAEPYFRQPGYLLVSRPWALCPHLAVGLPFRCVFYLMIACVCGIYHNLTRRSSWLINPFS